MSGDLYVVDSAQVFRQVSLDARLVGAHVTGEWPVILETITNKIKLYRGTEEREVTHVFIMVHARLFKGF